MLLSLPIKNDRLGLPNPYAKTEYDYSTLITTKITGKIYNQTIELKYHTMDQQHTRTVKSRIQQLMETTYRNHHDTLFDELTPEVQQHMKRAMEKGASYWISAMPIKAIEYALNKQEFRNATCMRYG